MMAPKRHESEPYSVCEPNWKGSRDTQTWEMESELSVEPASEELEVGDTTK